MEVASDIADEELKKLVLKDEKVAIHLEGKAAKKFIVIANKLVNIVV